MELKDVVMGDHLYGCGQGRKINKFFSYTCYGIRSLILSELIGLYLPLWSLFLLVFFPPWIFFPQGQRDIA